MKKKKKRLSRLIEMVLLIQSRPDWRPTALAEHFGISQTRIHQDIRALISAGIPIYFEGDGYKIARGPALQSISISPDEVLGLLYPDHLFRHENGEAPEAVLRAKLLAGLPADVREKLSAPASRNRIQVRSATPKGPTFRRLHDAVTERRRVRIRYYSRSSAKTSEREVDPYALIFRKHSWYLIGKCHRRGEVRKFRLSRVRSVLYTPLHFPPPRDFSLEEYTRGWWEVFGGPPVNVAVRFSRRVADLIRDRAPRPGQSIEECPGGDIVYRVHVRGIREIGWWIMQYGPDAEVLEPPELRDRIRDNAEQMARMYAGTAAPRQDLPRAAESPEPYHAEHD